MGKLESLARDVRFVARIKAFGGRVGEHRIMVTHDLDVLVWDTVAGHYTTCVRLTERTRARLVREAAKLIRLRP